ncbi:hypothetical protein GN316_11920 [Xylophilus sp. Kf1]|nr:hypothetical protein [Xylophilus sp. Kf1]
MRTSLPLLMVCGVVTALCAAAMAGLVTARVMPVCWGFCVLGLSLRSRSSVMSISFVDNFCCNRRVRVSLL